MSGCDIQPLSCTDWKGSVGRVRWPWSVPVSAPRRSRCPSTTRFHGPTCTSICPSFGMAPSNQGPLVAAFAGNPVDDAKSAL